MNVGFFVPVVVAAALASSCDDEGGLFDSLRSESSVSVSYTHLTLPTIYSV